MKWYEIQAAVSTDLENQSVDYKGRMYRVNSKDLCASLLEIRSDDSIEFVHSTARDYHISSLHINPTQIEFDLAMLSISYMTLPEINKDRRDSVVLQFLLFRRRLDFDTQSIVIF